MLYGTGYIQAELDGTEHKIELDLFDVPEEYSYIGVMPPVLDQGSSSKCVCYSLTGILDWKVNRFKGTNSSNGFDIDKLYEQRADKNIDGMQIKEALKYLRHTGLNGTTIESYAMVGSSELMKRTLILYGPIAIGLPAYEDSGDDFWNGRNLAGGHCVVVIGYNKDGFIIRNSWGKNWADKGHVLLPYKDFDKIFEAWVII